MGLDCRGRYVAGRHNLKCARGVGHPGDHACMPPEQPEGGRGLVIWDRKGGAARLVVERVQAPAEADG